MMVALTKNPFYFLDVLRARADLSDSTKSNCIEFTVVRNKYIDIKNDEVTKFVKAIMSPQNNKISAELIFKIVTGS